MCRKNCYAHINLVTLDAHVRNVTVSEWKYLHIKMSHTHTNTFTWSRTNTHTHTHLCNNAHMHTHKLTHTYTGTNMQSHNDTITNTHTHTHTHTQYTHVHETITYYACQRFYYHLGIFIQHNRISSQATLLAITFSSTTWYHHWLCIIRKDKVS